MGTTRSKAQLLSQTDSVITTNGTNSITGAILNTLLDDFSESLLFNNGSYEVYSPNLESTLTASSGVDIHMQLSPTYNQTSTAGSIGLYINTVETALGSGTHRLLDLRISASPMFTFYNAGHVDYKEISTPSTPASGYGSWYMDTADSLPKLKNDTGTVFDLSKAVGDIAITELTIAKSVAGDVIAYFNTSGGTDWVMGIDDDDSDKFKISNNASLGTSDAITISTSTLLVDFNGNISITKAGAGDLSLLFSSAAAGYWILGVDDTDNSFKIDNDKNLEG